METYLVHYTPGAGNLAIGEFEEALHDAMLCYSLHHLELAGITAQQDIEEALQRSMQLCRLAGINVRHHFKQVFVFNANTGEMYSDWLMSKRAFKLMLMQYPGLNEAIAHWLWELSDE